MSFEPQKYFIGLIDFFSILLPGALLMYMLRHFYVRGPHLLDAEGWAVFLFGSYLLGHFIFLLGARLLDDLVYEPIRAATPGEIAKTLSKGGSLPSSLLRRLASLCFGSFIDRAVKQAVAIKNASLTENKARDAINAFQWSKLTLTMDSPEALVGVQRFEANSKFFRSLSIVLLLFVPMGIVEGEWAVALISALLLLLAGWRYVEQRGKSISQAYWAVITLQSWWEVRPQIDMFSKAGDFTHAGGVVYRRVKKAPRYLLVQAKNKSKEWVLPKGHVEPGESLRETASREVYEESGVWGAFEEGVDPIPAAWKAKGEDVEVQFHVMRMLDEDGRPREGRERKWLPLDDACKELHDESKAVLRAADEALNP
jgi:ADP-ribose pyrophosphatase YjhB (NUDIX family)